MSFKETILKYSQNLGVFSGAKSAFRHCLRILSYHGVSDEVNSELNFDGFFVSTAVFRQQMDVLQEFQVVDLETCLTAGDWPDYAVAITFDDGYRNNLEVAAPILREYGYPASFFVTTHYIEKKDYPWWFCVRNARFGSGILEEESVETIIQLEEKLKNMSAEQRRGMLLQQGIPVEWRDGLPHMMDWHDLVRLREWGFHVCGHTASHISFGHEQDDVIRQEIEESIQRLRAHGLGPGLCYSYPYGGKGQVRDVRPLLESQGLGAAVTDIGGVNGRKMDRFMLRRQSVTDNHRDLIFKALVCGALEPVRWMREIL